MIRALLIFALTVGQLSPDIRVMRRRANPAGGGGSSPTIDGSPSNAGNQDNATSVTWSHTVGCSGTGCWLFVGVGVYNTDLTTGCTFNGDVMTESPASVDGGTATISSWYLQNPDTGTFNIVCNLSGGGYKQAAAISMSGVNTGTAINASASPGGSGANASGSVTPAQANSCVIGWFYWGAGASNPSASTWNDATSYNNDTGNGHSIAMGVECGVAASSQTMTVTSTAVVWQGRLLAVSGQ